MIREPTWNKIQVTGWVGQPRLTRVYISIKVVIIIFLKLNLEIDRGKAIVMGKEGQLG